MKKILALLAGLSMAISFTACGGSGGTSNSSTVPETTAQESTPETQPTETAADTTSNTEIEAEASTEETKTSGSNVLAVYYSATGNTAEVASYIASATGGDLFELEPVEPYSSADLDWTDDDSRVSREYADASLRDVPLVADTVDNWAQYDTVLIGYPIWWGIAAWPVDSFVEANDFTDKIVIPFCTSASSRLGESGQLLADLAGTGDWQEGQRFPSGVSESEVQDWVNGLNLS